MLYNIKQRLSGVVFQGQNGSFIGGRVQHLQYPVTKSRLILLQRRCKLRVIGHSEVGRRLRDSENTQKKDYNQTNLHKSFLVLQSIYKTVHSSEFRHLPTEAVETSERSVQCNDE